MGRTGRKFLLSTPEEIEQVCYLYYKTDSNIAMIARHFGVSEGVARRVLKENGPRYAKEHAGEIDERKRGIRK